MERVKSFLSLSNVRISVGLEDCDDIIHDLRQALETIER
ncbi:PLP-dependent transferase [Paenibacillus jiagnxiensis]